VGWGGEKIYNLYTFVNLIARSEITQHSWKILER